MRLLLDTHAFIWWDQEPEKLPELVLAALVDASNDVFLSTATAWEMQIKIMTGKLRLGRSLSEVVGEQCSANRLEVLLVALKHVWRLAALERIHGDPFDRLLIAQAVSEDLHLVSRDSLFRQYPVKVLWEAA